MTAIDPVKYEEAMEGRALWGAAAFAIPFVVYLATLASTVTQEDSGSFITAATLAGVPHHPGYPLWSMLAHMLTLVPMGTIAWRVALLDAFCAAGASWFLYQAIKVLLRDRAAALAGALFFAFSRTAWSQAVVAEVYSLHALFLAASIFLCAGTARSGSHRGLYLLALTAGLGQGNHQLFTLALPVLAIAILASRLRPHLRAGRLAACAILFILPQALFLYVWFRAGAHPDLRWADFEGLREYLTFISRLGIHEPGRQALIGTGGAQDLLGFLGAYLTSLPAELTWPVLSLTILGVFAIGRRRPGLAAATILVQLWNVIGIALSEWHRFNESWLYVHRVYHDMAHMGCVILAAGGLVWIKERLAGFAKKGQRWIPAAAILAIPLFPLWANHGVNDRCRDRLAEEYGLNILETIETDGVLMGLGDLEIFLTLYEQVVEGRRPDVKLLWGWAHPATIPAEAVYTAACVSASAQAPPGLSHLDAVPTGILYRLRPDRTGENLEAHRTLSTLGSFRYRLPEPPGDAPVGDLFTREIYGSYSVYLLRQGLLAMADGDTAGAEHFLDAAEAMSPGDAASAFFIARAYSERGVRIDRQGTLVMQALADWNRYHDRAVERYPAVTEEEILMLLDDLGLDSRQQNL